MDVQTSEDFGCPKCGSNKFVADKKGFSGGKAVVGGLLTGGIGLLAGFHGKNDIVLTCIGCGHHYKPGEGKPLVTQQAQMDIDQQAIALLKANKGHEALTLLRDKKGLGFIAATTQLGKWKKELGV